MRTTVQIYNEVNSAKPAVSPEKYIDQSFVKEALRDLGAK